VNAAKRLLIENSQGWGVGNAGKNEGNVALKYFVFILPFREKRPTMEAPLKLA